MPQPHLVGTWNLLSSEMRSAENVVYPLGEDCQGLLILDDLGNLAAQLMNPSRRPFGGGDMLSGTTEEIEEAYRGFVAFWGRYEVDPAQHLLRYTVTGSLFPNWIGHIQQRQYELDGDRLTLTTTPVLVQGAEVIGVLTWQRAASDPG